MSGNYAELTFGKDLYDVDGPFYGGCWDDDSSVCTVTSYKPGLTSGKIPGTRYYEKMRSTANTLQSDWCIQQNNILLLVFDKRT